MQRRRFKQNHSLEGRLVRQAQSLREEARSLAPGIEKEQLLERARQADAAVHMTEWLAPAGAKPPS